MRTRIVALAGVVLTGMGCSSPAAPRPTPAARARRPLPVACAAPARLGPVSRPAGGARVALPGAPDGIASTPDGRTSFVALQSGAPRVAVIANRIGSSHLMATVPVPVTPSGMRVTPDGRDVLAAAGDGALIIDAAAARAGSRHAIVATLRAPAGIAGHGPGAAEVAVSRDGRHAFVTLEGAGRVAVFDLRAARLGRPSYMGAVPVGSGALGIAVAPDGRTLYVVSESAPLAGRGRGALTVIDLARALSDPRGAVVATVSAPCAPVRVVVSPRGDTVWVTARLANRLLGYSTAALRRHAAGALTSVTPVGAQPLGVAAVHGGAQLLVADLGPRSGVSVVSVGAQPRTTGWVAAGPQADAIAPAAGGRALITLSGANALLALGP